MATLLYRIGRFSYRSRILVSLLWLALAVGSGVAAATLSGPSSDSFSIPGTESQEAFDLLDERFPDTALDGAEARVVFAAPEGQTMNDPANQAVVEEILADIAAGPQVAAVTGPYDGGLVSADGTIALVQVTYTGSALVIEDETRDVLFDAAQTGRDAGLTVELGGQAMEQAPEMGGELIGLGVAAVVLVITFGSLITAGMPLITGITGVGISVAAITAATGFIDIGATTPILATMLGLAVAIDYALFIASRYRHELILGRDGADAAGRAIATAGSAVVFAGLTVMVALAGLTVVDIPILTEMGLAAALTVAVSVAIALTLLPALLGFAGRRILRSGIPGLKARDPESDESGRRVPLGRRWVAAVVRRPAAVLTVALIGLGALALPATDLRLGVPDEGDYPVESTQRKAYDLAAEAFGPGFNGPLMVVVDAEGSADPGAAADQVAAALAMTDGVQMVAPAELNAAGDTAIIGVVPTAGPASAGTERLVDEIRSDVAAAGDEAGATVVVTGMTAVMIDFTEKMGDALVPYLAVVVGLSFLLLMMVFRSIVVPLKAALGFLLTIGATFGVMVAVFQWGWLTDLLGVEQPGMVVSLLPILITGIVFGLAMDYEVFLVTRMREEYVHGADPTSAVTVGFSHAARVVAAAAIIMISVFGGFVLGDVADIIQLGLGLAVAIAVDAFVVRMTVVPAVLALVGHRAWWLPRWLDRLLPDIDVEGAKLARHTPERENRPHELARD
jgi:RND superfamily putative drug exporter